MTTGLPSSNNFWLLSLIGGILLMFFGVNKIDNNVSIHTERLNEVKKQFEESETALKISDSVLKNQELVISILNSKATSLKESDSLIGVLKKYTSFFENASNELDERNSNDSVSKLAFEIEILKRSRDNYLGYCSIFIGLILFVTGYFHLYKSQVYRDRILFLEYLNLDVKVENCQSCGMSLLDDEKFNKRSNFCSFCFQNDEFILKDISLNEFKVLIEEQLKKKGFSSMERKSFLKKVNRLDRWKTKFNWGNFEENIEKNTEV